MKDLFQKYDIPAPRYTSYPTVPYWEEAPLKSTWINHLKDGLTDTNAAWSMYIHIPFCESLCTYCGCNTIITKDHSREDEYIELILKEWNLYTDQIPEFKIRKLKHLHIGGGTPTFLSENGLLKLLTPILNSTEKSSEFEASIEVDPRRTSYEQLALLSKLGFNRLSMGVQDFNPEVQRLVNRIQPFELTAKLTNQARELGYKSINFDLIYGLAKQTPENFKETIENTITLRPDRIALYSLAIVPWIKPAQRLFKDEDLPTGKSKRDLYELARKKLIEAGYVEVGMDHFSLPTDSLAIAFNTKTLHRNFMGYTDQRTEILLGLGVSSISETSQSFHQNEKIFDAYKRCLNQYQIPTHRGHVLNHEDQLRRNQILKFMTLGEVDLDSDQQLKINDFLSEMIADGLINIRNNKLILTETGRPFLRNACLFFDERLKRQKPQTQAFSKSI